MRILSVTLLMASLVAIAGCGSSSTTSSSATTTTASGSSNVMSIAVNGGPLGGYPDAAFASATVCAPGSTTNCVTINGLLVDTGSTGLRVFQSEVASLNLPTVNASNGSPAYDCVNFIDGSYMWGQVEQADVSLGSETAAKVPIQVISDSSTGVPTSCSEGEGGTQNVNKVNLLGANGILGVGIEPTDCYGDGVSACSPTSGLTSPPYPAYYTCSGTTCNPAFVATSNQVTNPVALFPSDNNGVVVELPAVNVAAASVTGSLVFGIGTESNNQLPSSATVFTLFCDNFTTVFDNNTYDPTLTPQGACSGGSFIDSGSNGFYFPDSSLTQCSGDNGEFDGWYCPSSTVSLSATNEGEDGKSKVANFSVANAETLFNSASTGSDNAVSQLAGPAIGYFDWGLPFFFGVNVYNAIDGAAVPSGAPPAPWWAY